MTVALRASFQTINQRAVEHFDSGSVAVVALILTDKIVIANCGTPECSIAFCLGTGLSRVRSSHTSG